MHSWFLQNKTSQTLRCTQVTCFTFIEQFSRMVSCGIFYLNFFQKSVDITVLLIYYRGSFWIKKLYTTLRKPKINIIRKTPLFKTTTTRRWLFFVSNHHTLTLFPNKCPNKKTRLLAGFGMCGGAAGHRPRVQLVSWYLSTNIGLFENFITSPSSKNKSKKPSFVTRKSPTRSPLPNMQQATYIWHPACWLLPQHEDDR